jgi:outer membrane protein assembly factor BamB
MTVDRVFTLSPGGKLLCLELETGKVVWQRNLAEDYQLRPSFFGVGTSPLLEDNRLLLNLGAKDGAGIVAFDKDTGKEVWKATDDEASYASPVAATLAGQRQVVFFTREGLVLLDPASGKVHAKKRWRARIAASVNAASPVVVGDEVFLSSSYDTGAILLRVGKEGLQEIWKGDESLSCHYTTPVYLDGTLYGIDGRQEQGARLRAVDWKTGKVLWTKEGVNCGSLLAVDGHLLVLSEDGVLRLVEATPAGYREKGKAQVLAGPCRAQLALAEGRLFARGSKKLTCWKVMKD